MQMEGYFAQFFMRLRMSTLPRVFYLPFFILLRNPSSKIEMK